MHWWLAISPNMFDFEAILAETAKGIQLRIRDGDRVLTPFLPKKPITIFRRDRQVEIPEWLCIKVGLL